MDTTIATTVLALSDATWGWIGGLLGALAGTLGGAYGTWNTLRHARSERERAYLKRAALLCWIFVLAFVAALFLVPRPWSFLLWVLYAPALVWGIHRMNRDQARIRAEDPRADT